jgi:hypothetical protein
VIAVDVARKDLKTSYRRDDLKRLTPGSTELELNAIVRAGEVALASLNAGQIGLKISVEVGNRK